MPKASKRDCEGKQCCCCPHFLRPSSRGENPLRKRQNALSDSYPFWKGKVPNTKKGGKRVIPPHPLTILPMHSSPPPKQSDTRPSTISVNPLEPRRGAKWTRMLANTERGLSKSLQMHSRSFQKENLHHMAVIVSRALDTCDGGTAECLVAENNPLNQPQPDCD